MNIGPKTRETLKFLEKLSGGPLTLGKVIQSIRLCDEISQTTFAKQLGISRQYLCDIEHGRRNVSPRTAKEYAKKLGYSEAQFVRLCLQDSVNNAGLKFLVSLSPSKRAHLSDHLHA